MIFHIRFGKSSDTLKCNKIKTILENKNHMLTSFHLYVIGCSISRKNTEQNRICSMSRQLKHYIYQLIFSTNFCKCVVLYHFFTENVTNAQYNTSYWIKLWSTRKKRFCYSVGVVVRWIKPLFRFVERATSIPGTEQNIFKHNMSCVRVKILKYY